MKQLMLAATAVVVLLFQLTVGAPLASADVFTFTSCHITGSTCDGGSLPSGFGTVTLTQSGTSVNFDVVLNTGNRFVETGAGGNMLFAFNDTLAGSTVTSITTTLGGTTVSVIPGGVSGSTNLSPFHADGTGDFTAGVFCTVASDCNGGSTPTFDDLHFTVTNATLAQLETPNANGNLFIADILCGATQTGCTGGLTGPVDVSTSPQPPPVPEPASMVLLGTGLLGVGGLVRRRFKK